MNLIDREKMYIQERILLSFLCHKDTKEDKICSLGRGEEGRTLKSTEKE